MAKRSKSKRKAAKKRRSTSNITPKAAAPAQPEPVRKADLATEYKYVVDDLQRIGIIAAILVAVLVVLSFFL